MMTGKSTFRLCAALLACGIPFSAAAEVYQLNPIVVTAKREAVPILETPASVDVIEAEDIRTSGASNVFDVLRLSNGISSFSYGTNGQSWGGMNAKVNIRGIYKGTLVMLDGAPMNMNETYYLDNIPVGAVDRIEIVKGASSVLYGSEATSGVINIITKRQTANTVSLSLGEYGKQRAAVTLHAADWNFAYNGSREDEVRGLASNGRGMNDADKHSFYLRYNPEGPWSVSHMHTLSTYNFNRYDTKTWQTLMEDSHYRYIEDFSRIQYERDGWRAMAYYNRSNRHTNSFDVKNGSYSAKKKEHLVFSTIGLDLQKQWQTDAGTDLLAGLTVSRDTYRTDAPISYDHGVLKPLFLRKHRTHYALFGQATRELSSGLLLTLGARQQWISGDKNYNAFTPDISLLKKLDEQNSVYAHAARSFRAPSLTQMYGSGKALGTIFKRNPLLTPEKGWTYEVGYKHRDDTTAWSIALFAIDLDSITYETVINNGQEEGVRFNSKYKSHGIEANYAHQVDDYFSYRLGVTFGNPREQDKKGVWKNKSAKQQYTVGLQYHRNRWLANLTGSLTAKRAGGWRDMLPLNLHVSYDLTANSRLALDVENLLNREDLIGNWSSPTSTKYYTLPRNVRLTYTYTF